MALTFYRCSHCGNIIVKVKDVGVPVVCCGQKMDELIPGTSDGAAEKHVPQIKQDGNSVLVCVGSVAHPMLDAHYIEWICIETEKGSQLQYLKPSDEPCAKFLLADGDTLKAAYAYCNLHGLWMSQA